MANYSTAGRPPKLRSRRLGRCREPAVTTSTSRPPKGGTTTHPNSQIYRVRPSQSDPFRKPSHPAGWVRFRGFRDRHGRQAWCSGPRSDGKRRSGNLVLIASANPIRLVQKELAIAEHLLRILVVLPPRFPRGSLHNELIAACGRLVSDDRYRTAASAGVAPASTDV